MFKLCTRVTELESSIFLVRVTELKYFLVMSQSKCYLNIVFKLGLLSDLW